MTLLQHPINPVEHYRNVADHAPYMISRHNDNGVFLYVSPASSALIGYSPEELIGRRIYEFVQLPDHDLIRKGFKTVLAQSQPHKLSYQMVHKDGSYVWFETAYRAIATASKQEVLAYSHDITDLKHVEDVLRILARETITGSGEDFFRPLVSQIAHAVRVSYAFITETDPAKTLVRMWAFWKGDNFAKPLAYPLANTPCDRVINAGETCYYPVGVQALFPKDQDLVDLNAQGYVGIPIKDSAGAIIGHLAVIDQRPLKLQDYEMSILKIFSRYAAVEMERLRHHHQYGASTN